MSALEHQIDQIVAPLGAIRPATRGSGRPVARRHTALGAAVAVLLAAVACGDPPVPKAPVRPTQDAAAVSTGVPDYATTAASEARLGCPQERRGT